MDAGLLERRSQTLLGSSLEAWRAHERVRVAYSGRFDRLNQMLVRYLNLGLSSGITAHPDGARRLGDRVLETLLSFVGTPSIQASRPERLVLAKRAEEYLRAHADSAVSVGDLCEIAGVNQRTLFHGFRERYGVAPMAYLKLYRLNRVRAELSRADFGDPGASVTRIATNWGFCHLGRFSVDYRTLFGECPIETLKRPSGRVF